VNTPDNRLEIDVGVGPSGLALDEARDRLYVMNRFTHDISIVSNASNPSTAVETAVVPLWFDPRPRWCATAGPSSTTGAPPPGTATRRARAATSSATSTASRGI